MTEQRTTWFGFERSDWSTSFVLGGLVIGQNLPGYFLVTVAPTIYRQQGLPLEQFWIFSLVSIPIWFKWLWAPFVDRVTLGRLGRRRSWLLACAALQTFAFILLLFLEPTLAALPLIASIFLVHHFIMATQDISVDGYSVDSLNENNRPLGAAVITVSEGIGALMAMAGLMALYDYAGWGVTVAAAALALLLSTLPALLRPEPVSFSSEIIEKASLRAIIMRRDTPSMFLILITTGASAGFMWSLFGAFLVDRGMTLTNIGVALGVASFPATLLAGAISVRLIKRFGTHGAMLVALPAAVLSLVPLQYLAMDPALSMAHVMAAVFLIDLLLMPMWGIIFTSRLAWAEGPNAGTEFTIQSSVQYAGRSLATASAGFAAASFGWPAFFNIHAALICVCGVTYLWLSRAVDRARCAVAASPEMPVEAASGAQ